MFATVSSSKFYLVNQLDDADGKGIYLGISSELSEFLAYKQW